MPRHVFGACRRVVLLLALVAAPAGAQTGANVLVLVNAASPDSTRIGAHYADRRQIPPEQVLRLEGLVPDPPDEMDRPAYQRFVEAPVVRWLAMHGAHDRILFIVLTKGIPLRVKGTTGVNGTVASVDSELTLLYRRLVGTPVPLEGPLPNPYFLGDELPATAMPFTHERQDIFLVTRLDAFTVDDVLGVIDRGAAPGKDGRFLLDAKLSWSDRGNVWLKTAAERLGTAGLADRVQLDTSLAMVTGARGLLGYYSWGSNDPASKTRNLNLQFVPGALAGMFVSTDGRTLREPPAGWDTGSWANKQAYYAGSPQSLVGDLIRMGATGAAGHVAEPYLGNTIRPDILFPTYVRGRSLAEAFYLGMPSVGWQTIVIGDPLCAPFAAAPLPPERIDPGVDEETGAPKWFLDRRLALLAQSGRDTRALKLLVKAEFRSASRDLPGVRNALEAATALDGKLAQAHMQLAQIYEAEREYERANQRYRLALAATPDDPIALNNLAYNLGARAGRVDEAMPLAQRANAIVPGSPQIADTLGWLHVLRNDGASALPLLERALQASGGHAEIRLHLAAAYALSGRDADASAALAQALKDDPALASSADAKHVRTLIK